MGWVATPMDTVACKVERLTTNEAFILFDPGFEDFSKAVNPHFSGRYP